MDCNEEDYRKRLHNTCTCINCTFVRLWYAVTGDSFVVDVTYVYSKGICGYLSKYLGKGMYSDDRQIMKDRGIVRLWSCSRNWERGFMMQRRGTVEKAWVKTGFAYGENEMAKYMSKTTAGHWSLEQVGTPLAMKIMRERKSDAYAAIHEKIRSGRIGRGRGFGAV